MHKNHEHGHNLSQYNHEGSSPFHLFFGNHHIDSQYVGKILVALQLWIFPYSYSSPSIGIKGTPNFYARKENKVRVLIINTTIHVPQSCICPFKCQQIILICFFCFYLPTRGNTKEIWNLETQCRCRRSKNYRLDSFTISQIRTRAQRLHMIIRNFWFVGYIISTHQNMVTCLTIKEIETHILSNC